MKKQKLSDDVIIKALLAFPTVKQASESIGRSERMIFTRLQDDSFKKRLESERLEMLDSCVRSLQGKITDAVEIIYQIATDKDNSAGIRLNACNSIISNSIKMTETVDILSRLARLEAMQDEL